MTIANFEPSLFNDYQEQLPRELGSRVVKGFLVGCFYSSFFAGRNIQVILAGGALSSLTTLVEAVSRPIIHILFSVDLGIEEMLQTILSNGLSGRFIAYATGLELGRSWIWDIIIPAIVSQFFSGNFYREGKAVVCCPPRLFIR